MAAWFCDVQLDILLQTFLYQLIVSMQDLLVKLCHLPFLFSYETSLSYPYKLMTKIRPYQL